ncbi:restriction endonuclease subunit S [Litorisediminicola beolgyonensis]|uniref:Restriction endonuclease subunit S n=1 Tax=Litorisediminicola beolgyonensis TaxID=1173614 RepID=A0ABW3ZJM3_9RHOB
MTNTPRGWSIDVLANLCGFDGLVSDGDWIESKDQDPDGNVRLIQLMDIGDGNFLNKSARFLTTEAAERLRCTFLESGDVLIARMPDPLGRACIFPGVNQPAVTAVDVLIWRPGSEGVSPEWIATAINSPEIRRRISAESSGTTRKRIAGGRLKKMELAVPPLPEQRRIVAKLDRLSARSAAARDHLARTSKLATRAKQAVMDAIFGESATSSWKDVALGSVVSDSLVGLVRSKVQQSDQGTPYIRMNHYDYAGSWNSENLTCVTTTDAELERYELHAGDVLFNTRNSAELVGKVGLWPAERPGHVYNNNLLRLRFFEGIDPNFAYYFMTSPVFRRYLATVTSATTSVAAIYQKSLMKAPFRHPGIEHQQVIVRRIEAAFDRIDRMTDEASRAAHLLDRLDERLLAKAFRGELVPQDPEDEPAEALLTRIREARAAAPKAKRGRRRKAAAE